MSSREAFESSQGKNLDFDRYPSGEYCDIEAQSAWEAWQAATERAANLVSAARSVAAVVVAKIREGNE